MIVVPLEDFSFVFLFYFNWQIESFVSYFWKLYRIQRFLVLIFSITIPEILHSIMTFFIIYKIRASTIFKILQYLIIFIIFLFHISRKLFRYVYIYILYILNIFFKNNVFDILF